VSQGEEKGGDILTAKKDLLIVVSAFCLIAALFMIMPTRSSPGVGGYDPWFDVNDDGKVNIVDMSAIARAFGTSGNPTKPVVIAGYNSVENLTTFALPSQTLMNISVSTVGYRTVTLGLYAESQDMHRFEIFWGYRIAATFVYGTIQTLTSESTSHLAPKVWYQGVHPSLFTLSLQVTFSEFWLTINNNSTNSQLVGTVVYNLSP